VNLSWPLAGPWAAFIDILQGARPYADPRLTLRAHTKLFGVDLACMAGLSVFSATVLHRWFRYLANEPPWPALASAFMCLFVLLMCVAAVWIEPTGYFRAFTECFVVGALLLFKPPSPNLLRCLALVGVGFCWLAMKEQIGWGDSG